LKIKLSASLFLLCFNLLLIAPLCAAEYILQPSDILDIQLLNNPKYNTKQTIAPDGTISLPFLGRVKAKDKTLNELDSLISTGFGKYLAQPQIVVTLVHKDKIATNIKSTEIKTQDSPIMLVINDLKKETTEVKSVKTVQEAKAWMAAGDRCSIIDKDDLEVTPGDIVKIEIGQPEPDPIYIVFYDIGKNTYDLKKVTTIQETRALIGGAKFDVLTASSNAPIRNMDSIRPGDTVRIEIGKRTDFIEDNWYKLLSGAGLVIGILNSVQR